MARDKRWAQQVAEDYTKTDMSSRERLISDIAVKISRALDTCSPQDVERLRGTGLDDRDVLHLVEIVAYQNMSTRIMEALSTID